jgi:F0F1-type ATP synthase assembly protein I
MNSLKIIIVIPAVLLLVIAFLYLLVYAFDVDASIIGSLKYLVPFIIGVGIIFAAYSFRRSNKNSKITERRAKNVGTK